MVFCNYLHKNFIKWAPLGTSHPFAGLAIELLKYPVSHGGPSGSSSDACRDRARGWPGHGAGGAQGTEYRAGMISGQPICSFAFLSLAHLPFSE